MKRKGSKKLNHCYLPEKKKGLKICRLCFPEMKRWLVSEDMQCRLVFPSQTLNSKGTIERQSHHLCSFAPLLKTTGSTLLSSIFCFPPSELKEFHMKKSLQINFLMTVLLNCTHSVLTLYLNVRSNGHYC
jgi:hypothetical protein